MNESTVIAPVITVVGVPEDGCMSLTSRAINAVSQARVLAGHTRLLQWFPQFNGRRLTMEQGYQSWFNQVIDESEEGDVVVLASGDPLFYGIGNALIKHLEPQSLRFIPSLSSMQLAFARLAEPWADARCISLHGRVLRGLVARLQQGDLFTVLTDSLNTPVTIARHLLAFGETSWQVSVCEQLGAAGETVRQFDVSQLAGMNNDDFDPLNVVVLKRLQHRFWGGMGQYADDEAFEKRMPQRGLITKQPIRHLALAALKLRPTDTVWDIGTGSGSIAIESAKQCWQGKVFTVECNEACYSAIEANFITHATDNVTLVKGKAPEAMAKLPPPDAVFVGGSRGAIDTILAIAWQQLKPGGVLIATAVTLDSVAAIYQWSKQHSLDPKVQLASISHGVPLAQYTRYQADNPIHLFIFEKPLLIEKPVIQ
ncbi:precorrin-6y C5,15-methyltransferase (decarboxylating) subunit CbiE [Photobacterium nomapromontoriensis]|uniref:precorrin-6y C5,15-methyltransferase (decarboxylating) subunit CbiE n=1 Tax=Photobacterium nomapromontoriensis TaxID=2910237 RepID=UPI003D1395E9